MRDTATPWAGTAANAAVVRNRTASDACAVTDGLVQSTTNVFARSQAGALLPIDTLQRVVDRNRAQASACALADGFAYTVQEPALIASGISMHIIPLGSGNIDSRYPRAYGDMLYIADGAAMSDGVVSRVWSASGLDKNLHIGHDPDGDIDSTYVYTPPVNHAPLWDGDTPTALAYMQGTGGTQAFGPFASDPDADALTFSLVGIAYSGVSINATTGLLTVTAAAAAAVRRLTIRIADPDGLFTDHLVTVTIQAVGNFKWFPGQYPFADTSLFLSKDAEQTSFKNSLVAADPSRNITGTRFICYWGMLEPGQKGVYDWTQLDKWLDVYGALGYKVYISVWWQSFGTYTTAENPPATPQVGEHPLPDYIIQQGYWYNSSSARGVKMWLQEPMDHFIDFLTALAARYDNDERLVMVVAEECTWGIPLDGSASTTTVRDGTLAQCKRLIAAANSLFSRTAYTLKNNFLGGQARAGEAVEMQLDLGIGIGAPDLKPGPPDTLGPVEYNMRYLRGERWNGTAWVVGVGPDQRMDGLVLFEKQVNRDMSWTPALCYAWARDLGKPQILGWSCQNPAYLYGFSGEAAYRIPAMDRANILAYLAAAPRLLRTDKPLSVGG